MITKQKKTEILKKLQENFEKAKFVVFLNFHGLGVSGANELRKALRTMGAKYLVAKKTLIKRVLEKAGFEGELPELEGEIGLAFAEKDPLDIAKAMYKFIVKNKTMKFAAGIFENRFVDSATMMSLAKIPSRETLLGQLVYIINSPIRGLVVTLDGVKNKMQINK